MNLVLCFVTLIAFCCLFPLETCSLISGVCLWIWRKIEARLAKMDDRKPREFPPNEQ